VCVCVCVFVCVCGGDNVIEYRDVVSDSTSSWCPWAWGER
jgi:hypothetical protein